MTRCASDFAPEPVITLICARKVARISAAFVSDRLLTSLLPKAAHYVIVTQYTCCVERL
jgi:hypothetical protein